MRALTDREISSIQGILEDPMPNGLVSKEVLSVLLEIAQTRDRDLIHWVPKQAPYNSRAVIGTLCGAQPGYMSVLHWNHDLNKVNCEGCHKAYIEELRLGIESLGHHFHCASNWEVERNNFDDPYSRCNCAFLVLRDGRVSDHVKDQVRGRDIQGDSDGPASRGTSPDADPDQQGEGPEAEEDEHAVGQGGPMAEGTGGEES